MNVLQLGTKVRVKEMEFIKPQYRGQVGFVTGHRPKYKTYPTHALIRFPGMDHDILLNSQDFVALEIG